MGIALSHATVPAAGPVVASGTTERDVVERVSAVVLARRAPLWWYAAAALAAPLVGLLGMAALWLFVAGIGIWGVMRPVMWGFAIANFVWWIGIGHAGTLISAILLLLHQSWRESINRLAGTLTLFAVMGGGSSPSLHMGRPWFFYWLLPYPNTMGLWPQFRSPLVWDVFAVSTYASVSFMFWYVGLIP